MSGARPSDRRRRAALLLALAVACGGFAAVQVERRAARADAVLGPAVEVVVASRELPAGTLVDSGVAERALEVRRVPRRFAPPDSLVDPSEALGLRLVSSLARGAYVGAGALRPPRAPRRPEGPRRGERAVEVTVAGGEGLAGDDARVARVDVLVTTDGSRGAAGRTFLALEDVELLAARPSGAPTGGGEAGAGASEGTVATLRVTLRQAVFLTAAQSFAREVRLLARPPRERRRARTPLSTEEGFSSGG